MHRCSMSLSRSIHECHERLAPKRLLDHQYLRIDSQEKTADPNNPPIHWQFGLKYTQTQHSSEKIPLTYYRLDVDSPRDDAYVCHGTLKQVTN